MIGVEFRTGIRTFVITARQSSCFKAAPYWLDEPQNLILAPGEDGRLVCRANGNPKPTIQWLMNGEPIESKRPEGFRHPGRGLITDTCNKAESPSEMASGRGLVTRVILSLFQRLSLIITSPSSLVYL